MRTGIERYFEAIAELQSAVLDSQQRVLEAVAQAMAAAIQDHKRLLTFGTGHSHLLAEEAHYRAGGLAPVVPILAPALMLHESAALGTYFERKSGLAGPLLQRYNPQPGELLFIFSNSGVNTVPVEMALAGKERDLKIIAICSMAYARTAPLSAVGKRLFEVADYTIDNGGQPGDALVAVDVAPWRVGPSSTVIGALLWNCLVVETARLLQAQGLTPPVFASSNTPGSADHNYALLDDWGEGNPHL